ncbi:hypothetical protein Syun_003869 [Stephania yunnanensis]|uniref:Uncharacterized protein n=1 Tax=Stephania yunnanensis TaxID=152371 RepID=A0AAP0Q082_9MAGN
MKFSSSIANCSSSCMWSAPGGSYLGLSAITFMFSQSTTGAASSGGTISSSASLMSSSSFNSSSPCGDCICNLSIID